MPSSTRSFFLSRSCCVAYPTFVPHSSQNFAPGLSSRWQFAHFAGACEVPHSLQNFVPAFRSAPHFTHFTVAAVAAAPPEVSEDRKSTRLNSSHDQISYAVFCLKKKKNNP